MSTAADLTLPPSNPKPLSPPGLVEGETAEAWMARTRKAVLAKYGDKALADPARTDVKLAGLALARGFPAALVVEALAAHGFNADGWSAAVARILAGKAVDQARTAASRE